MTSTPAASDDQLQADRKGIWGWMFFDWAAQPFTTLIVTFIFAPYFVTFVAPNAVKGQEWWGYAAAAGGIVIAFLAPILGAISDAYGPKKPWIIGFSIIGILGAWSLWWVVPGSSNTIVMLGLLAFVISMVGFEFATIFNNAMMPGLVPRMKLGALSGNAWALGYAAGLMCLIVVLTTLISKPETGKTLLGIEPILGLDPTAKEGERAVGPMTGIWFVVFVIPLLFFTPDASRQPSEPGAVKNSLSGLWKTIKSLAREDKSLFAFLGASMFYRDALNGLYVFGGIYAAGVLGWTSTDLGVFGMVIYFTGIFGCIAGGMLDNRIGTKNVVTICICILIAATVLVVSIGPTTVLFISVLAGSNLPDISLYAAGALIGAAGGALQAASRPLMVDQAKQNRMGEAFGLYALSGRVTAFLAPILVAYTTGLFDSQRAGMVPVIFLFVIGLILLIPVRSRT